GTGADFRRRSLALVRVGGDRAEARTWRGERVREEDDVLALLAQRAELVDQRFQVRIDLVEPPGWHDVAVTGRVELELLGCGVYRCESPIRVFLELFLYRQRRLPEQQIFDAEIRRHHTEQVLRPHHPVEQVDDRQRHSVTAGEIDVVDVEV